MKNEIQNTNGLKLNDLSRTAVLIANIVCTLPAMILREFQLEGLVNEFQEEKKEFRNMNLERSK